jgi:hypothetical protein
MPAASPLASSAQDGQPGRELPGTSQGPSLCWEGRREGLSPLQGGKLVREDISPSWEKVAYERRFGTCPKDKTSRHVVSESHKDLPVTPTARDHAWRMRNGSPLRRTCRRQHYRDKCGNDGQDRLVESHRCSAPGGVKYCSEPSPAGLRHHPKLSDICHTCNLATVVPP